MIDEKIIKSVKTKFLKGFVLAERYRYGLPQWRWVKDKKESKYPYIGEDEWCDLYDSYIEESTDKMEGFHRTYKLK